MLIKKLRNYLEPLLILTLRRCCLKELIMICIRIKWPKKIGEGVRGINRRYYDSQEKS